MPPKTVRGIVAVWCAAAAGVVVWAGPQSSQASVSTTSQAPPTAHQAEAAPRRGRGGDVIRCGIDMRRVRLNVADGVVLDVQTLDGELASNTPGPPPVFDDPSSYTLRIESGELSMTAASLTGLLARVFTADSQVSDLEVSIAEGQLVQRGKLHKGISVPFTMKTSVATTEDGRLRLHMTSLKAAGLPVKKMLDVFGVELENLMKAPGQRGLQIDGDDILLSPTDLLPPPAARGRVKDVSIVGDAMVMHMVGDAHPPKRPASRPEPAAKHYVYFHGGSVRFGRLTMADADLQLVDADETDPFDFFPVRYARQLVAGYSRNTPSGALKVVMPDYADVGTPHGRVRLPRVD